MHIIMFTFDVFIETQTSNLDNSRLQFLRFIVHETNDLSERLGEIT